MKLCRTLLLYSLLFTNSFSIAQVGYDTTYTRIYGNPVFYTEGRSLVEVSKDSLLLSTGYRLGGGPCTVNSKLYIVKENGDSIWSKISIPGNGRIIKSSDGNFININLIQNASNCGIDTISVCKFDIRGDTIWTRKFYFGVCYNKVTDVIQTADGGYAVSCFYSVTGCGGPVYASALIKLNGSGNTQWIKSYGSVSDPIEALSIRQTSNGDYGIYCFKTFSSSKPYSTYRVIKVNSTGDTLWTREFLNLNNITGYGDMDLLPNDEFLVTGSTGTKAFIARLSTNGLITLYKEYPLNSIGNSYAIKNVKYISHHNAYLFVGNQFILTDTSGTIIWKSINFAGLSNLSGLFYHVIRTADKGLAAIGYNSYPPRIFLVRFKDTSAVISPPVNNQTAIKIYPNPTRNNLVIDFDKLYSNVTVQVFNMLGQLLVNDKYYNTRNIQLFLNKLPGAVYVLRIFYDNNKLSRKIIKY